LFSKFKEKLAGFKESLSTKIQEKVKKEEKPSGPVEEGPEVIETSEKQTPVEEVATSKSTKSMVQAAKEKPSGAKTEAKTEAKPENNKSKENKNKGRLSFLDRAKSLVFEREVVIDEKDLDEPLWALEMALLESDVALPVAEEIVKNVKAELSGSTKKIGADTTDVAEGALRSALTKMLSENHLDFDEWIKSAKKPVKILFVGVNGTGKTTSIAKVTKYLQDKGYSVVLAAGDTFRAGAIEQLEVHANALGVKIIKHKTGGDPAAVIFDAIEYAKAHNKEVVLADTAGRLHTNINLMDQMRKINRVTEPDLLIFVDEAIAGNDAVERARLFNESVPIGGSILTKTDADAKGGSAISIAYITGKPVLFLGVGQTYADLVKFEPEWLVDRLLGEAA
jgi:fused signal recognition particle receptor